MTKQSLILGMEFIQLQTKTIDSGYTLQTTFFDNQTLEKLMIPFTNNDFLHSVENTLQLEGFDGVTADPYEILNGTTGQENVTIDDILADPLNQYDEINNEFYSAIIQTSLISYTFGYSILNVLPRLHFFNS